MAEQSFPVVKWILDADATPEEIAAVTKVVLEEGLPGQVEASLREKSLEESPWVILFLGAVALFFKPFLKPFIEEAGRHSYHDLRRLVSRLFEARREGQGHIEVMERERDSPTTIVFGRDMPEEAFKQLLDIGLENIMDKYWVWDPSQGCWISQSMKEE